MVNADECRTWLTYHCRLFPQFREWWLASRNEAMREVWLDQISSIALQDAQEASRAMLTGEFGSEHPPAWEFNRLPLWALKTVGAIRGARHEAKQRAQLECEREEARERREQYRKTGRSGSCEPVGSATAKLCGDLAKAIEQKKGEYLFRSVSREVVLQNVLAWKLPADSGYVKRFAWCLEESDMEEIERSAKEVVT